MDLLMDVDLSSPDLINLPPLSLFTGTKSWLSSLAATYTQHAQYEQDMCDPDILSLTQTVRQTIQMARCLTHRTELSVQQYSLLTDRINRLEHRIQSVPCVQSRSGFTEGYNSMWNQLQVYYRCQTSFCTL